ncbi:DsbA family protein [Deinococcus multiflagellatus]|uniref:DsbA family protein n=1 Tax=Deinococcus multiflagellatus TaxID=1656887 RepID=UPI001CCFB1DD|nr:DsbA family protein [Deinococcus multiflagellatus]MBZ9713221.1 DsbA family protein [Deinococcus multiflagellatus]
MKRSSLSSALRRAALILSLGGAAQAQLFATPQDTAAQAVLKGFTPDGTALRRGAITVTLDVAGGYVVGVLTETDNLNDLARGIAAGWGMKEADIPRLAQSLGQPQLQAQLAQGLQDFSDDNATDFFVIKATGTGAQTRYRAYTAIQIWPDSAFPVTRNVAGSAAAPNTLRIFSDFQCPYCKQLWDTALPEWERQPNVYRTAHYQFPLDFHKNAFSAAEASECAGAQGKFWPYADVLFDQFSSWTRLDPKDVSGRFSTYAKTAGLDTAAFKTCLGQRTFKASVEAQYKAGVALGVRGTPTVFLNGIKLMDYRSAEEQAVVQAITSATPSAASIIDARVKSLR